MMHQKIVAAPTLPQELIDRAIALTYDADHVETLVSCARSALDGLERYAREAPNTCPQLAEWVMLRHFFSLIEEKADRVRSLANDVFDVEQSRP